MSEEERLVEQMEELLVDVEETSARYMFLQKEIEKYRSFIRKSEQDFDEKMKMLDDRKSDMT